MVAISKFFKPLSSSWPAAASAMLLLLAFPPFNLGLLAFVALVPWLVQLRALLPRAAAKSGYLFGLVYGLGQFLWLGQFVGRWTESPLIGGLVWLLATVIFALYFAFAGWLMNRAWRIDRPWLIPLLWAGVEVFRSYLPVFAFPWGLIATPLWPYPFLTQLAAFGTIYLVGAWAVLISVLLVLVAGAERPTRAPFTYVTVFVIGIFASAIRLGEGETASAKTPLTIIQPGVDLAYGEPATRDADLRNRIDPRLSAAAGNGSLFAVLPEGLVAAPQMPPKMPFRAPPELPILFGGRRGEDPAYQSAFTLQAGQYKAVDKTRLVIFGEFVPFRSFIPYPAAFRLPRGDLAAGEGVPRPVQIAGKQVGPILCFEALFPDVSYRQAQNGAQMLAVMSLDDWFMGTNAPEQLKAATVWRAVETGLPTVRSASLGYSLAVDGRGRIMVEAPLLKPVGMRVELPLSTSQSVHPIWVFPLVALFSPLGLLRRRPVLPSIS